MALVFLLRVPGREVNRLAPGGRLPGPPAERLASPRAPGHAKRRPAQRPAPRMPPSAEAAPAISLAAPARAVAGFPRRPLPRVRAAQARR